MFEVIESQRMNHPRNDRYRIPAAVLLFALVNFAWPANQIGAQENAPAAQEQVNPLTTDQQQVASRYKKLEELLLRSAELESAENPARSALLQQAAQLGKQSQLADLLARAATRLDKKQYSQALEDQRTSRESLKRLLELLQSENRGERVREQRDQVRRWIEETDRLLRLQKSLSGRTEGGQEMQQASGDQEKLAKKALEIAKDLGADSDNKEQKNQESPSGENSESKPTENSEDGKSEDGSNKEKDAGPSNADDQGKPEEPAESKPNEPNPGEPKPGEPKPGEPKSGEPKSGEPKSGEPKSGEPSEKPTEGDKPAGKPNEDGKPSEPNEGSEKEGAPPEKNADGKNANGKPEESPSGQQPESGQSGESGEQPKQAESKDPTERARKRIEQAQRKMEEAKRALDDAERKGAVEKQREAEAELRSAIEALEEILRQLREEEIERSLASLETRLRRMLEMQNKVFEETKRLQEITGDQATRQVEIRASALAAQERKILSEGERAFLLLREEGSSAAFPEAMEQVNTDIGNVAERLQKADVGKLTTTVQQEIISSLEEMVAALVQVQKEQKEKKQKQQPGQPQQGEPGEQPLVDKLAELRLIRTLQVRINNRTTSLSQMLDDPADVIGQAKEVDILKEVKGLAERQSSIQNVTREIVVGADK